MKTLTTCTISVLLLSWLPASLSRAAADAPAATGPRVFDVTVFGAKGDGKTLDTDAINKAIEAASAAGGGTVYFPAGTFASYSVRLKSNIALYLDQGATLLAADPPPADAPGGYDAPEPNASDWYQDFGHSHWHNSLVWGENVENVSILGPGTIFGRGLSKGYGRKDPLPGEPRSAFGRRGNGSTNTTATTATGTNQPARGPFGYPGRDTLPAGVGNKSISLKNCRNVTIRDVSIRHGGHFAILVTGVDNLTIDNLRIDTNRDGMDIDCCRNVRVSNCTVNSPYDDGICLKSSYGLGVARATENVTIVNCYVTAGFVEGTLLDGTNQRSGSGTGNGTGRIKFGTESNGGFKNITIANCLFEACQGLAIESVDGAIIEDVTVNNIAMRDINSAPIFIRLGSRLRAPEGTPVGAVRRINISNIVVNNARYRLGSIISGIPGHPVEDVSISNVHVVQEGGGTKENAAIEPPERETTYPEPGMFGTMPSYGFFVRHAKNLEMRDVDVTFVNDEMRPAVVLYDVAGADFDHVKARRTAEVPFFVLRKVSDFAVHNCPGLTDIHRAAVEQEAF
jgi:polygalacturonase